MTLSALTIRGFQSHEKLRIPFSKGVTCIVGPSDVGKSSVLRALGWVALNRPRGQAFIRDGERRAQVTISVGGHKVTRLKGPGKNLYKVGDLELNTVRDDVPPQVFEALRLSATNFQFQHDSPFWFGDSPGEVSRQLNQIVNLGEMDSSLSNVAALIRRARTTLEVTRNRVGAARNRRRALSFVPDMVVAFEVAEGLEQRITEVRQDREALGALCSRVVEYQKRCETQAQLVSCGATAVERGEEMVGVRGERAALDDLVVRIREQEASAHQEVPDLSDLDRLQQQVNSIEFDVGALSGLVERGRKVEEEVSVFEEELRSAERELKKGLGKRCPLCSQPIQSL